MLHHSQTLKTLAALEMEEQRSPLSWAHYYYQEAEAVDELKHSLLYSTWELEAAVLSAHEEISRKEDEIIQLKDLLAKVVEERDEFKAQCHALALENKQLVDIQITQPRKTPSDDENADHLSSHSEETNNSLQHESAADSDTTTILCSNKKPLPENGKFLQAVMEAGPLLQTLLLAGPLPRWQHPPPQLSSSEIPPVVGIPSFASSPTTPNSVGFKRAHAVVNSAEVSVSPNKYQKVVQVHHHQSSSLTQLN